MTRHAMTICALALVLTACGEKAQTAQGPVKKADGKAWDTTQPVFLAPGYKAGDQAAWESQMRERVQAQNEYSRSSTSAKQ